MTLPDYTQLRDFRAQGKEMADAIQELESLIDDAAITNERFVEIIYNHAWRSMGEIGSLLDRYGPNWARWGYQTRKNAAYRTIALAFRPQ